jgi:large repetitive protein
MYLGVVTGGKPAAFETWATLNGILKQLFTIADRPQERPMNDRPNTQSLDGATPVKQDFVQLAQADGAAQPETPPPPGTVVEKSPAGIFPAFEPYAGKSAATANAPFAVEKPVNLDLSKAKLTLTPDAGKPVVLPADTQIAAILVVGEDLVIREEDGDLIVIKGGVKAVPSIVLGTIEIPAAALVASLQANGISLPAAGEAGTAQAGGEGPQSSGGNFARGPGGIGDPFNIRDLLDFSERERGTEKKDLAEGTKSKSATDFQAEILSTGAADVDEDGLKGANPDGVGNSLPELDGGGLATRSATVVVNFGGPSDVPNNLINPNLSFAFVDEVSLDGQLFNLAGQPILFAIQGQDLVGSVANDDYIRISVTGAVLGVDGHTVTYTYQVELLRPIKHSGNSEEDFDVLNNVPFTVTDRDGDTVNGSLDVTIYDDVIERKPLVSDGDEGTVGPIVSGFVQEDGLGFDPDDSSEGIGGADADDEDGGLINSLNALFSAGADSPLSIAISDVTTGLPALLSKGDQITYAVSGNTLTASAGSGATLRVVFTLKVNADSSWDFDLKDQLDHVAASGDGGTMLRVHNGSPIPGIDFSSIITASDADGDTIIGATPGAFVIRVENDVPLLVALEPVATEKEIIDTDTLIFDLKGGNTAVGGIISGSENGIIITGDSLSGGQDTANTSNNSIGVGNGQIVDGQGMQGQSIIGPEILTLKFFKDVVVPNGNANPTHGAAYDVNTFRFAIDAAEAQQNDDGVVFVSVLDGVNTLSPLSYILTINGAAPGLSVIIHDVYQGTTLIGRVYENVPDNANFEIKSATGFDGVNIGNYNGFAFQSSSGGGSTTLTTGNGFKVYGIEADIVTITNVSVTQAFKVGHDETAGVNDTPDPNDADDVTGDGAPAGLSTYGNLGFAMSAGTVKSLFDPKVGADEEGTWSFKITDESGDPVDVDSGLDALDGTPIMLSTSDGGTTILGKAGDLVVFAITIDGDGKVWVAQDLPIKHGVTGSTSFAHDDIVSIIGKLYVNATLTDADGDSDSETSKIALQIDFQDDGPKAANDSNSVAEGGEIPDGVLLPNVLTNDIFGSDGPATGGGVIGGTFESDYGTLVLQTSGSYTYTSKPNTVGASAVIDSFTYTIVDGDGDTSTATLDITIQPSTLLASNDDTVLVNEAGLPSGSSAGIGSNIDDTNTLTNNFSGGTGPFTYSIVGAATSALGTLLLNPNGTYTYTLTSPYTGASSDNGITTENNRDSFTFEVKDSLGNTSTATLFVDIIDDVPTLAITGDETVAEDLTAGGTIGGDIPITEGADQDATLAITLVTGSLSVPILFTLGAAGSTQTATVTVGSDVLGVLSVTTDANGDATWTFDPALDVTQPASFSFVATVTDKDGDVDTDTHTVTITDGADPTAAGTLLLQVDERNLAGGTESPGNVGDPDTVDVDTGALIFTAGSDSITDVKFSTDTDGISVPGLNGGVTIAWSSGGTDTLIGKIGTVDVIKLEISGDQSGPAGGGTAEPTITATLLAKFPHEDAANVDTLTISGIKVDAVEADGDKVTATIAVEVIDDLPNVNVSKGSDTGIVLTTEDAETIGANFDTAATASGAFAGAFTIASQTYGADGAGTAPSLAYVLALAGSQGGDSRLDSNGVQINLFDISGVIYGSTTDVQANATTAAVFKIEVDSSGVVTITQFAEIDHPILNDPDSTDAPFADDFAVLGPDLVTLTASATITDADGDSDSDSETIDLGGNIRFADHGPVAFADVKSAIEGQTVTGNVLSDGTPDAFGADGPATTSPVGGVTGVAAGSNTSAPVSGGVGTGIPTTLGTLTLLADGSYTYVAKPNNIAADTTDTFVYTITDGDGDTSTVTLTINLTAVNLSPVNESKTVDEAALDTTKDDRTDPLPDDLAASLITGSNPTSGAETVEGALTVAGAGIEYTPITATGSYGEFKLNADGTYTYTLTKNHLNATADNGAVTIPDLESFTYTATDDYGNTITGTVKISIIDDVPGVTAVLSTAAGAALDETATSSKPVTITWTPGPAAGDDPNVDGAGPIAVGSSAGAIVTATPTYGADGAAATGPLTYAFSLTTAASGLKVTDGSAINLQDMGDGVILGVVDGGDFDGQVAIAIEINPATGVVTVEQYLSLQHPDKAVAPTFTSYDEPVALATGVLKVIVTAKDGDGDTASTDPIDISAKITFDDDGPTAPTLEVNTLQTIIHDETPGVQPGDDVLGTAFISGISGATIADQFTGITGGDDPHVTDNPIGYARSGVGLSIVTLSGGGFGADGPHALTPTHYALLLGSGAGTPSAVSTTAGTAIFLYQLDSDTIIGRVGNELVGGDTANAAGDIAFAISINATTGELYTVQYLSLLHTDTNSFNEISGGVLASNAVQVAVTYTDGDGDTVTTSGIGIGSQIQFADDGPTLTVVAATSGLSGLALNVDETEGTPDPANFPEVADGNTDDVGAGLGLVTTAIAGGLTSLFTVTGNAGADGGTVPPGTLSFAGFPTTGGIATNLIATDGGAISLFLNAGVIEGRDVADSSVVFTIAIVDVGGGVMQLRLTQYEAINHGDDTVDLFDEVATLLTQSGTVSLQYSVTLADGDGDAITQSATIPLIGTATSYFTFDDDGPGVTAVANTAAHLDDETAQSLYGTANPGQTGDDAAATATASGTLGHDYGSDGAGATLLSSVAGLPTVMGGLNSFFYTVSNGGKTLIISQNQNGSAVQVVQIDLTNDVDGSYTVKNLKPVFHGTPGTTEEEQSFTINYTVTDKDGDTAEGTLDVTVDDDMPKANPVVNTAATDDDIQTEFPGNAGGASGDVADTATAMGLAGSLFTAGADGFKSISVTPPTLKTIYKDASGFAQTEDVSFGTPSVLAGVTTLTGTSLHNGTVLTLVVNADGSYSFIQAAPLVHPTAGTAEENLDVVFNFTVTDGDDDIATGSLTVKVNDDTPLGKTETATTGLDDDAQTLFAGNLGGLGDVANATSASGAASSLFTGGADGVKSIAFTPQAGLKAIYSNSGTPAQETLTYTTTTDGSGNTIYTAKGTTSLDTVFTLSVNVNGSYTYTEFRPLVHPTNSTSEENLTVQIGLTITDGDGDTTTATLNIKVNDDTPDGITPERSVLVNEAGSTQTAPLDLDGNIDPSFGADGGRVRFSPSLQGAVSDLTSSNQHITYSVTADGLTLAGTINGGSTTVFTVVLNPDGNSTLSNDSYTITMLQALDGATSQVSFDANSGYSFVGGNDPWAGFTLPAIANSKDLLITPMVGGVSDGTVNTSNIAGGVGDANSIGSGEAVRLDFVVDLTGNPQKVGGAGDYSDANNQDHVFSGHYNTNGASATFTGISGGSATSEIRVKAFHDSDVATAADLGADLVGDGTELSLTAVAISFGGQSVSVARTAVNTGANTQTVSVGGHNFTVNFQLVSGVYESVVGQVVSNTQIAAYTADPGYNSLEFHWDGGQDFKIGSFGTTTVVPGVAIDFTVPVEIVDGDGDVASSFLGFTLAPGSVGTDLQDFSTSLVGGTRTASALAGENIAGSNSDETINGDAVANVLFGNNGIDTISGLGGNDTLIGGQGNDVLRGGTGNDNYVYDLTDGNDTIDDNNAAAGGGTDKITIVLAGSKLTQLGFADSNVAQNAGNMTINVNGQTSTVVNQFVGGNNTVENLVFEGGGSIHGFSLGSQSYVLSIDDDNARNVSGSTAQNIIAGDSDSEGITGSAQRDLLFGNGGVDTIIGGDGDDYVDGGAGGDALTGGEGGDFIAGGLGLDTINLAETIASRDTVYIDSAALADSDTINNFLVGTDATSDVIDLSELFVVDTNGTLADHIRMTGTALEVDTDGTAGAQTWQTVATITGFVDGGINQVSILYNNNGTDDTSGTVS